MLDWLERDSQGPRVRHGFLRRIWTAGPLSSTRLGETARGSNDKPTDMRFGGANLHMRRQDVQPLLFQSAEIDCPCRQGGTEHQMAVQYSCVLRVKRLQPFNRVTLVHGFESLSKASPEKLPALKPLTVTEPRGGRFHAIEVIDYHLSWALSMVTPGQKPSCSLPRVPLPKSPQCTSKSMLMSTGWRWLTSEAPVGFCRREATCRLCASNCVPPAR